MIDLASIRIAILVAEHLSFRRAATALGVQPSATSRRVRELEDQLGVSLFERHSGGVRTTLAGERFLERARATLSDLDEAVRTAGLAGQGLEGRLSIGVFLSLASPFLQSVIRTFLDRNPSLELDVVEGSPGAQLAKIRDGRVDIALVPGASAIAGCDTLVVMRERAYVALPADHDLAKRESVDWSDLKNEHFLVLAQQPGPSIQDYIVQKLADVGPPVRVTRYDVSRENLIHLVGFGLGIAFVGEGATALGYPNVVFRQMAGRDNLAISAVWAANNDNPMLRRFLAHLRAVADNASGRERS